GPMSGRLLLNDVSWIFLIMPWPPFMMQNFAFRVRHLQRHKHHTGVSAMAGPRQHLGADQPGAILQFFKDGPFAWNGIFASWIPAWVVVIQCVVNVVFRLNPMKGEDLSDRRRRARGVVGGRWRAPGCRSGGRAAVRFHRGRPRR